VSILFVLLMFLLILTVTYFRTRKDLPEQPEAWAGPKVPRMEREYGFSIPQGYSFHPGHTWVTSEGGENARIGLDSFAANLLGKVDQIDVAGTNRWVRQGQKIMTIKSGEVRVEMLSPIEGVITTINRDVVDDPTLATRDPYKDGWIAMVKSPDFAINRKNLVQGPMVAPWMQNNVSRLNSMVAETGPMLAQDGGHPVSGVLSRVAVDVRQKLINEFFLN
jgi:glycine cleavage system H lipoate-binding protein